MIADLFPYGLLSVFAYLYYVGIPLALAWAVLSFLKSYPRPGIVRRILFNACTRDRRSYFDKCNRLRDDGPTPCFCCRGRCYGARDGSR